MTETAKKIFALWLAGQIDTDEATARMDVIQVRGGFGAGTFTGYDYDAQKWVEFD